MAMKFSGLRRWVGLAALASGALVGAACGVAPRMGGEDAREPPRDFFGVNRESPEQREARQLARDRGYNGTIQDIGSSIDPRTPDKEGVRDRSLPADLAWQRMGQRQNQQGLGGSGSNMMQPELGPEDDNDVMTRPDGYLQRLEDGRGNGPANAGTSATGNGG
jgi:hypothetical protein